MATFSASWTLPNDPAAANAAQPHSEAFSSEWTLNTIPESMSDTATLQGHETPGWDRSTAFSDLTSTARTYPSETATTIIPSSQTFEKSWTLPRRVDPGIPVPPPVLPSHSWSPGAPVRGLDRPDGSSSISDIMGRLPSHVVPGASTSSNSAQYHPSPAGSAVAVFPGNYRPRGYSNNAQSSSQSAGLGQVRPPRPAAYATDNTSPRAQKDSSASAGAVSLHPAGTVVRPAGFSSDSTSPWNLGDPGQVSSSSAGSWNRPSHRLTAFASDTSPARGSAGSTLYTHRPPRPAGFAPDTVTPQTPGGDQPPADPATASLLGPRGLWLPIDAAGHGFAPIEVPVYAATLPETNPWLFADLDQAYNPPAAPLTATAPWHADDDEIQWRNL